jgi:DNA-directed RNA polymerase subunit RPC12/RpoP
MAKEVQGWRDKHYQGVLTGISTLDGLLDIGMSHDGWACPYCDFEEDMERAELSNGDYGQLMQESYHEPLERECEGCGKKYFLKAHVVIKYSTCIDKTFEE